MFILLTALALATQTIAAEEPVDPYVQSNANAGTEPFTGGAMLAAFHGREGVHRIVVDYAARLQADRRIADIFKGHDMIRFNRTLEEQFCYILNGGCDYSGRTMVAAHKDLGLQAADMGALVEDLQAAMRAEHVGFGAQNRFLAKLAPMKRDVVER